MKLSDIKEPRLLCLIVFTGGGTKLLQSYLDGHPEIYNIPAYPLVYFYAHWEAWEQQYQEVWNWDTIINIFCIKHSSVIDSRNIVGMNGLDKLGEGQDGYVSIDGEKFRGYLKALLCDEPVSRRSFVLAIYYAYALCKGQDLSCKKILLWHHHNVEYLDDFVNDFPDAIILATIRDPRIKVYRLWTQFLKEDQIKLSPSDAMIYRYRAVYEASRYMFRLQHQMGRMVDAKRVIFLKHEDIAVDLRRVMQKIADLLGIPYLDLMLESSFDGKAWWGHEIHGMPDPGEAGSQSEKAKRVNQEALKRVISTEWKDQKSCVEVFVFEGMMFDFLVRYGYQPFYYRKDAWVEKAAWMIAALLPFEAEIKGTLFYLNPKTHWRVIQTAWKEARGEIKRKYYGFNGTYFYKHSYIDLNLWKRPFKVRWYVLDVYARFLAALLLLPVQYFRRLGDCYFVFFRRLFYGSFMASKL